MPVAKRFGSFFILLLILTIADFFYLDKPAYGIDDANIFFKYAQNIIDGHGFVFNSGGEHVEGFTSLLWVLVCSILFSISAQPEFLIMFFLLLLTTATLTMVYGEVKKNVDLLSSFYFKKYFFWIYCAFIICIGPSFLAWSVLSLMENGLWNFLFVLLVILVVQFSRSDFPFWKKLIFVSTGILLVLTRPEAFAWILVFVFLLVLIQKKYGRSLSFPILFFFSTGLVSLLLIFFRIKYFGYPLPNTYYAKVSGSLLYNIGNGVKYTIQFFTNYNPLISLLFILLVVISFSKKNIIKAFKKSCSDTEDAVLFHLFIVTTIILINILLPLTTGGDHFGGFRFYQGCLPLFAWGLPTILWLYNENIKNSTSRNWITLCFIALFVFLLTSVNSLFNLKTSPKTQLNYEFYLAAHGRENAEELNQVWHTNPPSVGMITVGGFGFKYKGETIDLMGLNNTIMGHSKGDRVGIKNHAAFKKDEFYQLQPDILLPKRLTKAEDAFLSYAEYLNPNNFENQAMKNIFNDSIFKHSYQPVLVQKKSQPVFFFVFANNNFLNKPKRDSSVLFQIITL